MHKYVIVDFGVDYNKYVFKDADKLENCVYLNNFPWNKFVRVVFEICFVISKKLNIKLFAGTIWILMFKRSLKHILKENRINDTDSIRFIFNKVKYYTCLIENGVYEIIKEQYINSKVILTFFDLLETYTSITSLDVMRNGSDIILSYDENERKKYNFGRIWEPFGSDVVDLYKTSNDYDVFFCGSAKDRLECIYSSFDFFVRNGFKCLYYINNVQDEKMKKNEEIVYNKYLSYDENLRFVAKSKIILDIVQKDAIGRSLRILEAIVFNKIYISNNKSLLNDPLYDSRYMFYFENIHDINIANLLKIDEVSYDIESMNEIKLDFLLRHIEKYFNE